MGQQQADLKAAMRRIVSVFETGNAADIAASISPDYIDHQGLRGVEVRGPDGFAQVVATARDSWGDIRVTIEDLLADDDRIAARLIWHGKNSHGGVVDRESIEIVRFVDGLAVEHWGGPLWTSITQ